MVQRSIVRKLANIARAWRSFLMKISKATFDSCNAFETGESGLARAAAADEEESLHIWTTLKKKGTTNLENEERKTRKVWQTHQN
jgi:hypothetical protein